MKTLVLFLAFLLGNGLLVQAQSAWPWATQFSVATQGVATDAAGNSYVTGSFAGTITLGGTTLTSRGQQDLVLVKYTPAGQVAWAVQLGRDPASTSYYPTTATGTDVDLDAAGNVYVVGSFSGTLVYGAKGAAATISSFNEAFASGLLAKVTARGEVSWVERFGIPEFSCTPAALATDAQGNSYITGASDYGGIRFGNQVVGGSRRVLFVARYTPTGAVAWARVSANRTSFGARGTALALDGRGNCLVGGFFNREMQLEGTELTCASSDTYLACFAGATGGLQWVRAGGAAGAAGPTVTGLAADALGNIYATGAYSGTTTLWGATLPDAGEADVFLARFSRAGTPQWVRALGTPAPEYSTGLSADAAGYCALVGYRLMSATHTRSFLSHVAPTGDISSTETLGTRGQCQVTAVAQHGAGSLYLAGNFTGTVTFGQLALHAPTGGANSFLAQHRPLAPAPGTGGEPKLEVFPNPARGRLVARLSWSTAELLVLGQASLLTPMGVAVAAQPLLLTSPAQAQATFDCASLPAGLYVLRLRTTDGTVRTQAVDIR